MKLTGSMLIGKSDIFGSDTLFKGIDPATGEALEPAYGGGKTTDVYTAAELARTAFQSYREISLEQRAQFLECIADQIMGLGDALLLRAQSETGLPRARLEGERGRTVNQLRLFASVVRTGDWLGARIDFAQAERTPMPRSDIRLRHIPLGPVAVFGASNFPLAFSVAGGDTASALAAGAPVIVKGHCAHPGTSELVGRAIRSAVALCDLHEGVFSLLFGVGNELGQALVAHPDIKAVAFTGSRAGGLALMQTASLRPEPIPVYAEMSSINPMFLMPEALQLRAEKIAEGFVASLIGSAGQLCTNPGLIIALASPALDTFITAAKARIQASSSSTMLSPGIYSAYQAGAAQLTTHSAVQVLARGRSADTPNQCQATLLATTADAFLQHSHALGQEVFGACSLIVICTDSSQMLAIAESIEGQLTATLHFEPGQDQDIVAPLLSTLELKAGRILANGFPTGVEVGHAMVHGGPFPATSDSRSTSVGSAAIHRFLRPVAYQDIPDMYLPTALKAANPWGITRMENP